MSANRTSLRRRVMIAFGSAMLGLTVAVSGVAADTTRAGGLNTQIMSGATRCYTTTYREVITTAPVIKSTVSQPRFAHARWTVRLWTVSPSGAIQDLSTRSTYGFWRWAGSEWRYTFDGQLARQWINMAWRGGIMMHETIELTDKYGNPLAGGTTSTWEDEYTTDRYIYPTPFTSTPGICIFG